eukprot:CAMPEP_0196131028 /NCGR_PEP_ID=MMETSP0910-20130528/1192_1 /TAXON_ID=49265 /ORGANISM="Thalassiosira rotula, Strain GSO102" /LENGTH=316 /DNA_ID=CAMNT_0041390437 /DNA_START=5 /DNA_END=955 /DNA_ORIENTATION=-
MKLSDLIPSFAFLSLSSLLATLILASYFSVPNIIRNKRSLEEGDVNDDDDDDDASAADASIDDGTDYHDDAQNKTQGDNSEDIAITNVLDTIGTEIYKFVLPTDLLHFSLTNHHIYDEVSTGLIQACLRQLPPNFVCRGIDHSVSFHARHTFPQKENLMDHLLDKIKIAELKLIGTENDTTEDALTKAREVLTNTKSAKFYSHNKDLPSHLRLEFTSAGYHHEHNNKKLATSRSQYILSRMSIESECMSNNIPIVQMWIDYILCQRHIVAGTWFWSCRHRNLDFQGVEGKGVMISSPKTVGEEMEICWTRTTASRV